MSNKKAQVVPQRFKMPVRVPIPVRPGTNKPYMTPPMLPMTPGAVSSSTFGAPASAKRFRLRKSMLKGLSPQGVEFLKCAFAPPDFNVTQVHGVPDAFEGNSLVKKHKLIAPVTLAASVDTYYLLAPVPGIAYFTYSSATPPSSTTSWTGVPYGDHLSLFGTNPTQSCDIVTKFRVVSNHLELVPTTNAMQWTGNIQAWKIPVTMIPGNSSIVTGTYTTALIVQGLQGAVATNSLQYTAPFNSGVYACAYNSGAKFDFSPILENVNITATVAQAPGVSGTLAGQSGIALPGFDNNFESVIVKISGVGTNINDTMIIKTWSCVEYQVSPGTSLYEFMTVSPTDAAAMDLYRKIIRELPVAVSYYDNESFWERVLSIIRGLSSAGRALPGAYGRISGGINNAANAASMLLN